MPQAKITINSVPGSDTDLPINLVVQLDNQNTGGELTFTWSILDQPPGAVDALSSVSAQNPFFTPKKEGTYLIRLLVNQGLPTEQEDRVVAAVVQLKTLERIPAAGETTEGDTSDGWATSQNSYLRRIDTLLVDPGILVGVNTSGGTLTRGQVVRSFGTAIIKSGLPGQETLPGFTLAHGNVQPELDELLCVVEGTPSGAAGVPGVGSTENRLMKVRYIGRLSAQVIANGPISAGDVVFINDAGNLDRLQGTIRRRVGSAMDSAAFPLPGSTADVWFNGVGGSDIDLTPIDRAYVVYGNPGMLPNAFRVDGVTNASSVIGGNAWTVKTGDVGTITQVLRRFSSLGLAIQQWQDEVGVVLAQVLNSGQLQLVQGLSVTGGGISVTSGGISMSAAGGNITFGAAAQRIEWPSTVFIHSNAAATVIFNLTGGGTAALLSDTGTFTQLLMNAASGANLLSIRNYGGATGHEILGTGAVPLTFSTDSAPRWRVAATGELQAQGGNRAIQNVLDPVNAQDAVTKTYHDTDRGFENGCHNGNFQFWQRTNAAVSTSQTAVGVSTPRAKNADRWTAVIRVDGAGTGAGTNTVNIQPAYPGVIVAIASLVRAGSLVTATVPAGHSYTNGQVLYKTVDPIALGPAEAAFPDGPKTISGVTGTTFQYTEGGAAVASTQLHRFSATPGSETAMRVTISAVRAGLDSFGFLFLIQELDRDFCRRARGKPLTISFKWARNTWGSGAGIVEVIQSTGDGWRNYTNYNGVNTGILSNFIGQGSIPLSLNGTVTTVVTSAVAPDTNAIALTIGREWFGSSGAGGYFDITDVIVQIGDRSNYARPPTYPYAGGSWGGEQTLMQQFYETSSHDYGGFLEARPYSIVGFPYSGVFGITQNDPYPGSGQSFYGSGLPTGIASHPWIIAPFVATKRLDTYATYVLDTARFGVADIAGTTGSIYDVVAATFKTSNVAFGGFSARQYYIDIFTADAQPRTYACRWFVDADY